MPKPKSEKRKYYERILGDLLVDGMLKNPKKQRRPNDRRVREFVKVNVKNLENIAIFLNKRLFVENPTEIKEIDRNDDFGIIQYEVKQSNNENEFFEEIANLIERDNLNQIRIFISFAGKRISTKLLDIDLDDIIDNFYELIEKLIQSNQRASFEEVEISLNGIFERSGGSCEKLPNFLKNRKGMIPIINKDNLCGQRCLLLDEICSKNRSRLLKNENLIKKKLNKLIKKFGLPKKEMSFKDFEKYTNKKVIIITELSTVLYETDVKSDDELYIYYDIKNKHYHFINNINSFTSPDRCYKWCRHCSKPIIRNKFKTHKCKGLKCNLCNTYYETEEELKIHQVKKWISCENCNGLFFNQECLNNHHKNKNCSNLKWRCGDCKRWITGKTEEELKIRKEEHKCGEVKCKYCNKYFNSHHRCFIQQVNDTKKYNGSIYAYDFESKFTPEGKHIVNFIHVCELYTDFEISFDNIETFVEWLLKQKNSCFIAHNSKAYDGWLIHKYIIDYTQHRPSKIILSGQKIMYMRIKSIKFIDSLNHVAFPLSKLPKIFGLDTDKFKKGYFPYKFNIEENQKYIGKIPDIKYFDYKSNCKSKEEEKKFLTWYEKQKNKIYDFRKELIEYCISDVKILKEAMEVYRDESIELNNIDPLKSITIASYALKVYRQNHMPIDDANCVDEFKGQYEPNENKIAILTKYENEFARGSLRGGRTNAIRLHKKWSKKEIANGIYGAYDDIQSLYPTVQYYDYLPCGIPTIHKFSSPITDEKEIDELLNKFGIFKVDVTPTRDLFHPVLVSEENGKIKATLTPKIKQNFTSVELKKAVEKGYIINKIYEIHEYKKSKKLFKDYVANFLKIKVQYSGFYGTIEEFKEYNKELKKRFGFIVKPEKIENGFVINKRNEGRRNIAKLLLNSLWGKLGQRLDLTRDKYITKPVEWFKLLKKYEEKKIDIKSEQLIGKSVLVSYSELGNNLDILGSTNSAIATFVTANARLRLYQELEKLNKRVLYFDTDSIIYEYDKSRYNIKNGKFLGDWENETENIPIHEYVGIAPKTYGYKYMKDGKEVINVKSKGFTLNLKNQLKVSFDTYKKMVYNNNHYTTTVNNIFDKRKDGIYNKIMEKKLSFNYDKRIIHDTVYTYPIGYIT